MPKDSQPDKIKDRLAQKCGISTAQIEDAYPCTGLQAGLVAASLHGLGDYVSRFVFDVSNAAYESDVYKAACESLHKQTAILRSRVVETGGPLLQVVTREPIDWLGADDLHEYLAQDRQKSFVFGRPLARFAWIQEPNGMVFMVWSLHHCQYDEWSFKMMVDDLNAAATQLHSSSEQPCKARDRPTFSRFIKALSKIDSTASHTFWQSELQKLSHRPRICPNANIDGTCRTSNRHEKSCTLQLPPGSAYQPSTLAVAAWSLLLSHLTDSTKIFFGNVFSGRTFALKGIQETCGPTLATVPWCSELHLEEKVKDFLQKVEDLRLRVLPFEQTGLDEYRQLVGTAAFDTLLSVRSSQERNDQDAGVVNLQPQKLSATDLNHPCCVFIEIDISGDDCRLKADYDERYVDAQLLGSAMDKLVSAIEMMPQSLDVDIHSLKRSLHLPDSIEVTKRIDLERSQSTNKSSASKVDDAVMQKIQQVASTAAGSTETDVIAPETTLMQLGMDSLKTVALSRQLSKTFHVSIPFKDIAGPGRTLLSLGRSVEQALNREKPDAESASKQSLLDMAETRMKALRSSAEPFSAEKSSTPSRRSAILLTGATGYLGTEILRQCLATDCDQVIVLVRCGNSHDGMDRITNTTRLAAWQPADIAKLDKVTVWPSDLAQAELGLDPEHWQLLSNPSTSSVSFKAIIHNGAKVDFLQTYDDLEAANVQSTQILLEQHLKMREKPSFVYVTGGRPCPMQPAGVEETASKLSGAGGYAQTKFVSEVLMHKTKALYERSCKPVRMSIVHPGAIIGSSRSGVANTDDFVWRYVAASASMGCYVPAVPTKREWINLTPVDSVASAIMSKALDTGTTDRVELCLIRMGLSIRHFWDVAEPIIRGHGQVLEPVSEWEWLQELEHDLDRRGKDQPLYSLSQLLLQGQITGIGGQWPIANERRTPSLDTTAAEAALRRNIQYLTAKNFFNRGRHSEDVFVRSKG